MNRVSPAKPPCVVANGLNDAFVPSACSHAAIARTFSDVTGMLSFVRKSRAHCTESTPDRLSVPELVGTAALVAEVLCAFVSALANEPEPAVVGVPVAVVLGSDVPSTPPVDRVPNWLSICWMRA